MCFGDSGIFTGMPIAQSDLVAYLDSYLQTRRYPDASNNGLQVQGPAQIDTIAIAVDACVASFEAAITGGAQCLIVHHGLFWSQHQQIVGPQFERIQTLINGGLGLYASHIPLDAHPEVGNNAELARIAGLQNIAPWGDYKGTTIGFIGDLPEPLRVPDLYSRMEAAIGEGNLIQARRSARQGGGAAAHALCKRVAVCSGFGVSMIDDALAAAADTLITGETSHQWYQHVQERDINVIYCGHYASETVGVKALSRHLEAKFDLRTFFIDLPTEL